MAGRVRVMKTMTVMMGSGWMSITLLMKTQEKWWESRQPAHFPLAVRLLSANSSPLSCQAEKLQCIPVEERKAKAAAISGSRLLTQDDFKKIRLAQIAKEVDGAAGKGQKRKMVDTENEDDSRLKSYRPTKLHLKQFWKAKIWFYSHRGELLTLRDIEKLHKKPKADKETRLATAMVMELSLLHVEAYIQAVYRLQTILQNVELENGVHSPSVTNNACKHVSWTRLV